MTASQLSPAQLAAAVSLPSSQAISDLRCFEAGPLGGPPALNLQKVMDSTGLCFRGRDKTSLFLLALPVAKALGVASDEALAQHLREAEKQEQAATGSVDAKKAISARAFLTEMLYIFRESLLSVESYVLLPGVPAGGGKSRAGGGSGGGGSAGPVQAPAPPTPAVVHTQAAPPLETAGCNMGTEHGGAAGVGQHPTQAQQLLENQAVQAREDAAYMQVVGATTGNQEVLAALLSVLQVTRNAERRFSWTDLRGRLLQAKTIMITVGDMTPKAQVLEDAMLRGDRLLDGLGPGNEHSVLNMFTNLLPRAHGVSNELFQADINRCRRALGGSAAVVAAPAHNSTAAPAYAVQAGGGSRQPRRPRRGVTLPLAAGAGGGTTPQDLRLGPLAATPAAAVAQRHPEADRAASA